MERSHPGLFECFLGEEELAGFQDLQDG